MQTIFIIIITAFSFAIILAIFFSHLAKKYRSSKVQARMNEIDAASQYRRRQHLKPESDKNYRAKDKILETKSKESQLEQDIGIMKYDPFGREIGAYEQDKTEIVGLAEPKGFWSKFIMNQKLGFILARISLQNNNKNGYWVNTIKAQSVEQGKNQGKGR